MNDQIKRILLTFSLTKLLAAGEQFDISKSIPLDKFLDKLSKAIAQAYKQEKMPSNDDGAVIEDPCDKYSAKWIPIVDPDRESCMKTYREFKKLGVGVHGRVLQVCELDDCNWALKVQRAPAILENSPAAREIASLRLLQDVTPQLVPKLEDYWRCLDNVYIVMELADKTFIEWLRKDADSTITSKVAGRLVQICKDLANKGVLHGDMKPDNLLVKFRNSKSEPLILVSDFGFSSIQDCSTLEALGWLSAYCEEGLTGNESTDFLKEYNLWQLEKSLILSDATKPLYIETPAGKQRFSEVGFPEIPTTSRKLFYEYCNSQEFVAPVPEKFAERREEVIATRRKIANIATAIDQRLIGAQKPVIAPTKVTIDIPDIGYL